MVQRAEVKVSPPGANLLHYWGREEAEQAPSTTRACRQEAKKRNENWHHGEAPALILEPVASFLDKNDMASARADERQK